MKLLIVTLVLLCAAASTSAAPGCRCFITEAFVNVQSIATWDLNPFCNKKEVIVTLKSDRKVCLDPNGKFFKYLRNVRKLREERLNAAKNKALNKTVIN